MGSASAVADDVSAVHACDLAAASTTDPLLPPGIVGVSQNSIDPKVAVPACQEATASAPDNVRVLYGLARAYYAMNEYDKARPLFIMAADRGYADAQVAVGASYRLGRGGFPKDDLKAVHYLKLASAQGHAWGEHILASAYSEGRGGLALNAAEAARLTELAAEQGLSGAQYDLGTMYADGTGVARDDVQAVFWYRKATAQGNKDAKVKLAQLGGTAETSEKEIKLACDDQLNSGETVRVFISIDPASKYVKMQYPDWTHEFRDGAYGINVTGALLYLGATPLHQYVNVGADIITFGGRGDQASTKITIDRRTGLMTIDDNAPTQCSALPNKRQF
jgi:hypothetical protein